MQAIGVEGSAQKRQYAGAYQQLCKAAPIYVFFSQGFGPQDK
jgi:hypothetical protein